MFAVKLKPFEGGTLVSIQCQCGNSVLLDRSTRERSFNHRVVFGGPDILLACASNQCDQSFLIHPQQDHVHVKDFGKS